jgi:hypothetical protein
MFDFESISKITKANASAINSANTAFAGSLMTLAHRNYIDMTAAFEELMDLSGKSPMGAAYDSWTKMIKDSAKIFTPAPAKKD